MKLLFENWRGFLKEANLGFGVYTTEPEGLPAELTRGQEKDETVPPKRLFDPRTTPEFDIAYSGQEKKKKKDYFYRDTAEEINEDEPFQDAVKAKHPKMKKRLIGLGGNKEEVYPEKPSFRRSKSSPPGFQGS